MILLQIFQEKAHYYVSDVYLYLHEDRFCDPILGCRVFVQPTSCKYDIGCWKLILSALVHRLVEMNEYYRRQFISY